MQELKCEVVSKHHGALWSQLEMGKPEMQHKQRRAEKCVKRCTFGFKAPISQPRALRMGLDYCR